MFYHPFCLLCCIKAVKKLYYTRAEPSTRGTQRGQREAFDVYSNYESAISLLHNGFLHYNIGLQKKFDA